jgi:hypothetical protein
MVVDLPYRATGVDRCSSIWSKTDAFDYLGLRSYVFRTLV